VSDASWVEGAEGSGFGLAHLPLGVFSAGEEPRRVGVAVGDRVLDLAQVARAGLLGDALADPSGLFAVDRLNPFLAAGPAVWAAARDALTDLLGPDTDPPPALRDALLPRAGVALHLPFAVADYVDFYSSLEHATNLGRLFRPDAEPLLPNWRHLPVGYHGRAGTVVVSGTPVRRPAGQRLPPGADTPAFGPSQRLDVELELGIVAGPPSTLGEPVPIQDVPAHVFGVALVNDWSARDLQAWEYQPLGPFLGKSFATSIAPWVTPLAALEPFRLPPRPQDPPVLPYLRGGGPWALDLGLEVVLRGEVVSRTNARGLYWTFPQQLAHATVNGASIRTGDLYASGTISGPERGSEGSLLERTLGGREPLTLADGSTRTFLEDGDDVTLRGQAGGDHRPLVTLAEVTGTILTRPV
jgi:fumarylacetoacetase